MKEFLAEYARAWGAGGYLAQRGLIPSPADVQAKALAVTQTPTPVNASELK
jgi:phosphate transport system substrate-binding protein